MKTACDACGYGMEREPGFYLGSIYVNYGLTAVILVAVCSPIVLWTNTPYSILTPGALLFCVLFPMWFHRYARSFWLGFDYRWDGFRTARVRQEPQGESPVGETPAADPQPNSAAATCPFCHHRRAFGPEEAGKWKDCPKCGNSMLLAVGGPPPAG